MTVGDAEMFTVSLKALHHNKAQILKDVRAVQIIPLLSSLEVTRGFFGFLSGTNITDRHDDLQPNRISLWVFLSLDGQSISNSDRLAFNANDYKIIKKYIADEERDVDYQPSSHRSDYYGYTQYFDEY